MVCNTNAKKFHKREVLQIRQLQMANYIPLTINRVIVIWRYYRSLILQFANCDWQIGFYDIPCLIKQAHVFEAGYAEAP